MNKIQKLLTSANKEIKGARAKFIAEDMEYAQKQIIEKLAQERREIERKLLSLSDLYPDSELSLRVVKKDFSPDNWGTETQELEISLIENEVRLSVAKKTYEKWFGIEDENKTIDEKKD